MTTEQRMLALATLTATILSCLLGCAAQKEQPDPLALRSPYDLEGDVFVAVAPLANESGVSVVDPLAVSDALVYQLQQVDGLSVAPMNRTLAAMDALGLQAVQSPQDAVALAKAAGADAIIAGSITAWDPYDPPEIGLTIALFGSRPGGPGGLNERWVNPREMQGWVTEYDLAPGGRDRAGLPVSAIARHIDAARADVRRDVRDYAVPRVEPGSPLGWERYTKSMTLFTEYACHRLVRSLLVSEAERLAAQDR